MTNTVTNILSHDEELALRKPIEDYVGKIQAEIDELREEGTNKVLEYSEEIEVLKRDKKNTKIFYQVLVIKKKLKKRTLFIRTVCSMQNLNILKICKRQKIVNMMRLHLNIT